MGKMLHISAHSLEDFLTCRRLYWYKRIKKYERIAFNLPFLVGRVVGEGLGHVFEKKVDPVKKMLLFLQDERKMIRNTFSLTEKQEKDLTELEYISKAMITSYMKRYGTMIRDTKHLGTEVPGALEFGENVTFVIKMDNLFYIRNKLVLREGKTTKYITPEYISRIHTNRQIAIYYHVHNFIHDDMQIDEIMFDVIKKPSIRLKKKESYPAFLQRLSEYYDSPKDMDVFHVERFKEPKVTQASIFNTIEKVSEDMLRCKTKEDYYEDHDKCTSYYGDVCPYYELCHEGGETKENLVLYQIRKPYHVDKSNKIGG